MTDALPAWHAEVERLVAAIPPGRVMTYGGLAAAAGHPGAARQVGFIARCGSPGLPWHRVVRAGGLLAWTDDGGDDWQRAALVREGVAFTPGGRIVDLGARSWTPPDPVSRP